MFKKIFSILLLTAFVQLAAVDQSDKTAVVKAAFTAIAQNDSAALWQLIPPAVKEAAVKNLGSEAEAIKGLSKFNVSEAEGKDIIKNLSDREFLENLTAAVTDNLVCVDGKWYITIPDDGGKIDLSTRELLASQIMLAVTHCDAEMLWLLLAPEERIGMAEKFGSISAAIKEIAKELSPLAPADKEAALKKIQQAETVALFVEKIKNDTVQINGQWFLDPKVYHDSFDRSDKTAVLKTYLTAVCTLDADNIWKTILPATRLKIIAETENGDVASAKKEMLAAFSEIKEFQSVKDKLNDPAFINTMLALHEKNLIRINGNWYINLE